jgi:hypothetical protein
VSRGSDRTADVIDLEESFKHWFPMRRFFLGLILSSIALVEDLLEQAGRDRMPDALKRYPPLELDRKGNPKKTLTIKGPRKQVSLRGYVNRTEAVILGALKRFDYVSAAPHTTWAWSQHRTELEKLFSVSPKERTAFGLFLWRQVTALPAPAIVKREVSARPFSTLLRNFATTASKNERSGAHLQAMVYAYLRADSPNVTIVAARVRAGSNRFGAVGDVDGWYGAELALTAEVRDIEIDDIAGLSGFIRNLSSHRDPTAMVVARKFAPEVQEGLAKENILTLTRAKLAENVDPWDIRKQQEAMRHFEHYIRIIERSDAIGQRFDKFLQDEKIVLP